MTSFEDDQVHIFRDRIKVVTVVLITSSIQLTTVPVATSTTFTLLSQAQNIYSPSWVI